MREVVLLQKINSKSSFRELKKVLNKQVADLEVELMNLITVGNNWAKISFSGEDEDVAVRFLEKTIGLAPVDVENIEHFSVMRGRIIASEPKCQEVFVDVGVILPKPVYAVISLQCLQGQLTDGKKLSINRIIELYGLSHDFPLEVRILKNDNNCFQAELTERQLEIFEKWIVSELDRLLILGAGFIRVENAVTKARLNRDVVKVETLGALDCMVVCKLGTDVFGLVPKLGKQIIEATLVCFSPRRILGFVGERWQMY